MPPSKGLFGKLTPENVPAKWRFPFWNTENKIMLSTSFLVQKYKVKYCNLLNKEHLRLISILLFLFMLYLKVAVRTVGSVKKQEK